MFLIATGQIVLASLVSMSTKNIKELFTLMQNFYLFISVLWGRLVKSTFLGLQDLDFLRCNNKILFCLKNQGYLGIVYIYMSISLM